MSAAIHEPVELAETHDDPEVVHLVCHCTNDNTSACGLDVSTMEWEPDVSDNLDCPLCVLAWPDGTPCPSGCTCEECLS